MDNKLVSHLVVVCVVVFNVCTVVEVEVVIVVVDGFVVLFDEVELKSKCR